MSEGGHTPEEQSSENRPPTPTERSKRFIEDCTDRIKKMGINALASGVTATLATNYAREGKVLNTVIAGLTAGITAYISANEGYILNRKITRLSDENARLKEDR